MSKIIYCDNDDCAHCMCDSEDQSKWVCKAGNVSLDASYGAGNIACLTFKSNEKNK